MNEWHVGGRKEMNEWHVGGRNKQSYEWIVEKITTG